MKNQWVEFTDNDKSFRFEVSENGNGHTHFFEDSTFEEIQSYLNQFISYHPDFFYLIDPNYCFRYANEALLKLWGKDLDEIVGENFESLGYPQELVNLHELQLQKVFQGQTVRGKNSYTNPAGKLGYFEYVFLPLRDEKGDIRYVGGITRDITDQEKLEQQKQQLLFSVVHDLKNPLNVVKGVVQLQKADASESDDQTLIAMMERSLTRLENLTNNILDSSRLQMGQEISLNLMHQDLKIAVEEAFEFLKASYGPYFDIESTDEELFGYFDFAAIQRVIENLGNNAIKYGDLEKPVTIRLSKTEDNQALLCVHNWGEPIEKSKMDSIFKLFIRTNSAKRPEPGWGIGLTVVDGLVAHHKGRVDVTSTKQEGTTFKVYLPLENID